MQTKQLKTFLFLLKVAALSLLLLARHYELCTWAWFGPYQHQADITIGFLIFALTASVLVSVLVGLYRRREKIPAGKANNVIIGLNNIYYIILVGAALMTILGFWGIDFKTLFTTLSIVAAAIAIISKEYISDIISGMFIAFSKDVAIDDLVKVGDYSGKIVDIGISKTALLNDDDDLIYIPNHKFFIVEVTNYTKSPVRTTSLEFELELEHLTTLENLEDALISSLDRYKEYIEATSFNLKVVHVYKDYLHLKFQYILNVSDREMEKDIRRKTVRQVVDFIRTHGGRQNKDA